MKESKTQILVTTLEVKTKNIKIIKCINNEDDKEYKR